MSEDPLAPIPEFPGEDPDWADDGPFTDGYGLSDTLDSGYDLHPQDAAVSAADKQLSGSTADGSDAATGRA